MDNRNDDEQLVKEMIDSGEYFSDAMRWYHERYQMPIVEKAYCVIITCIALLSTFYSVSSFLAMYPIAPEVPFVIVTPKIEEDLVTLDTIGQNTEDANKLLLEHFIHEYVEKREEYAATDIERQSNRLRALSTPEVYGLYRRYISNSNPNSPIILYENHSERDISGPSKRRITWSHSAGEIEGELFEDILPDQATVDFTATVQGPNGSTRSRWTAEIVFDYQPVVVNQETFDVTPMNFAVTRYDITKKRTSGR